MYKFHYLIMKPAFNNCLEICFQDTDSYLYEINLPNITNQLYQLKDFFDFSNYVKNHLLYSDENKKVPGLFKSETGSETILQFCGLRSKCYSLVTNKDQKLAAAGVKKCKHRLLKHHDYVETLCNFRTRYVKQKSIVSHSHNLFTQEQTRLALSPVDIKRYILSDGISTIPYGYS